jgi:transcriptional regulator with XRE-family HTH domain
MARPRRRPTTHIGQLIDRGLASSGLQDRSKLEELCGLSYGHVSHIVKGDWVPNEQVLRRIATALNQDVEDYHVALLADQGVLPPWGKVFCNDVGIQLDQQDEAAVIRYAEELARKRRGA